MVLCQGDFLCTVLLCNATAFIGEIKFNEVQIPISSIKDVVNLL